MAFFKVCCTVERNGWQGDDSLQLINNPNASSRLAGIKLQSYIKQKCKRQTSNSDIFTNILEMTINYLNYSYIYIIIFDYIKLYTYNSNYLLLLIIT